MVITVHSDTGDDVVAHKFGEKSANKLSSCGFQDVTFKSYSSYVLFLTVTKAFLH